MKEKKSGGKIGEHKMAREEKCFSSKIDKEKVRSLERIS
jgi:hypothetical protein